MVGGWYIDNSANLRYTLGAMRILARMRIWSLQARGGKTGGMMEELEERVEEGL